MTVFFLKDMKLNEYKLCCVCFSDIYMCLMIYISDFGNIKC